MKQQERLPYKDRCVTMYGGRVKLKRGGRAEKGRCG